jgi:ABC-type polysaccharide/polyol phosphate transport system ATPase subunit
MIVQTFKAAEGSTLRSIGPAVATVWLVSVAASEERSAQPGPGHAAPHPAVSARHVSKSFRLPHEQYHTLKERALHPFRARTFDVLRALRDVSLEVASGEFFGIVGRNGSGKSTLLKCLAGIYDLDDGELEINGRLSPFIELGVGFNPDLTARDNVVINAIMLGLSRKQARERFDDVIAFAELEDFIDLKLKNYSSGMYVRLAFATAVQVDADILLIDEVLAVGDAAFQQKCFDEFTRLQSAGRTLLFVTHDMASVERFCNRAMLLERGQVVDVGEPSSIARQYNQLNFRSMRQRAVAQGGETETFERPQIAEVRNAWFESEPGEIAVTVHQGEPCAVRMDVHFSAPLDDPIFAITLQNEGGQTAFSANTDAQHVTTGHFDPETTATIRIPFENWLAPGRYRLFASVARAGFGADEIHAHVSSSIIVLADGAGGGIADLPHRFEIEHG